MATTKKPEDDKDEPKTGPRTDKKPDPKLDPNPVGAQDPYPTGGKRDEEADFEAAHGFRREKPKEA